jgi:hypothetical protein
MSQRCAELSEAAGERLTASAVTARRWLLVEVPGAWPRDVAAEDALPGRAQEAIAAWLASTPGARLQFIRRPARDATTPVAFVIQADEDVQEVRRIALEHHDGLADIDLDAAGDPVDGSLVLVCGHGSRDRCCALRGTAVFSALEDGLGEEELWISSHQGGHRFAANVLVLPAGLQFGRVEAGEAVFLVARALAGRIELDRYRGRTSYEPVVQAAEHAVRLAEGRDAVDDLRLAGRNEDTVRFRTPGGLELEAIVEVGAGPPVPASCGADPEPQRSFAARVV